MLSLGLSKMLMSDGFETLIVQILVVAVIFAIVILAWLSTSINEPTHFRIVPLRYRRTRRAITLTRLTAHVESSSIEGTLGTSPVEAGTSNETIDNRLNENSPSSIKPPGASTSADTATDNPTTEETQEEENEEIQNIFQIMDADTNVVRMRRLAYYENRSERAGDSTAPVSMTNTSFTSTDESSTVTSTPTSVPSYEVHSPEEPLMEHNYAAHEPMNVESPQMAQSSTSSSEDRSSNITVKLKYLNDDLKLVDGRLKEKLGDFKRRHFHSELTNNKIVKLIFNGQVLQSDSLTLQACGLFDNCVVHCLIHQQRQNPNESVNSENYGSSTSNRRASGPDIGFLFNNNEIPREWNLGNLLFALTSIILGSAWYFRYEYSHLYTLTATGALVAITGIYTIFLVGIYFPIYLHQQTAQADPL